MIRQDTEVHVLGIGFGPANIALAAALSEQPRPAGEAPLTARFFEKKPDFSWHPDMLLEGATMQIAFLKDLVTQRNPVSPLSFVAYLSAQGRLSDFINHQTLFPTRIEFHDYLEWAAGHFADQVEYGAEAVSVRPRLADGRIDGFEVQVHHASTGLLAVYRARSVVVAPGLTPYLPEGVVPGERIWHSGSFLSSLDRLPKGAAPRRFVVIGAGQSAAEVTDHLHRTFPAAEVCSVFSGFGYTPTDDSPFVNQIFDPATVDLFHAAPVAARQSVFGRHRATNYSVVDLDLVEELYRRAYQEKVAGRERLRFLRGSRVTEAVALENEVKVTVESLVEGTRQVLGADAVVYATGYRPAELAGMLGKAAPLLERDERGELIVERDYRARLALDCDGGLYLQGGTEHSHGITSSLISNAAMRAGDIAQSLMARAERDARVSTSTGGQGAQG
ncbi:lysine N(6)-hydroxylase/L-ornithine N(5)-oxygenase family protein [Streptomyces sp. NPDC001165]|uniref:lysine N(6)-hydroxylase/L-ornithine N(5)-oxygenase family protein n=1 Tax=Streptomyces sp. NPDC001165 TaxID=3364546 RepID=UPI003677460A